MNEPEYDKSIWTLDSHTDEYALLTLNKDAGRACVIRRVDGDWEANDSGTLDEMRRKFMRVTGRLSGIGCDSFDQAYPHDEWEQLDALSIHDIEYFLWARRDRTPNPSAMSVSTWHDVTGGMHWEVVHQGKLWDVKESWNGFRATSGAQPIHGPSEPNPTTNHPNFGRF
ncbi:hypothetical protein EVC20_156 [Rhizobium phage RHph_Y2_17_1]|nr:hypothetical protein EVC19_156 [Rhizobium phage RHph_Y2_11]QIG75895.1 hypothetical protein EVC20_156 [Rhizobium phage RHph_Y2_17_1]